MNLLVRRAHGKYVAHDPRRTKMLNQARGTRSLYSCSMAGRDQYDYRVGLQTSPDFTLPAVLHWSWDEVQRAIEHSATDSARCFRRWQVRMAIETTVHRTGQPPLKQNAATMQQRLHNGSAHEISSPSNLIRNKSDSNYKSNNTSLRDHMHRTHTHARTDTRRYR